MTNDHQSQRAESAVIHRVTLLVPGGIFCGCILMALSAGTIGAFLVADFNQFDVAEPLQGIISDRQFQEVITMQIEQKIMLYFAVIIFVIGLILTIYSGIRFAKKSRSGWITTLRP